MPNPLDPLKESIKHVPVMRYALGVVALASAASLVLAYSQSVKLGIIGMSVVVLFMIILILVTNIPKLRSLQRFVSIFLGFILFMIFTWSALFTYSFAKETGIFSELSEDGEGEVTIDVFDEESIVISRGEVFLKIPGSEEISKNILDGNVAFQRSHFFGKSGIVTIKIELSGYQRSITRIPVDSLLKNTMEIRLQKKEIAFPKVQAVKVVPGENFCDKLTAKITSLELTTPPKQALRYTLKLTSSSKIVPYKEGSSRYKYVGGYLIITINESKEISFRNRRIDAISTRFGDPEPHVRSELNNQLKAVSCSLTDIDIEKLIISL